MKTILILFLIELSMFSYAQKIDSVDNIILKVPPSWQMDKRESFTELKFIDNNKKSFCQVLVYNQQAASVSRLNDFENEWNELVEKNFTLITVVKPVSLKDKKGNSYQRYGAKAIGKDGNKYYVQLNVYDCGTNIQSIVAVSKTKEQLTGYDSLWQQLITSVRKQTRISEGAKKGITASISSVIVGTWHRSSSSPSAYTNGVLTNLAYSGYTKGEYNFKSDGTYTYQGESWSGYYNSNEFRLMDETGHFTISSNQLVITPSNGLYRVVDRDGKLKNSEKLTLAQRNYTWQTYYYEGLQETDLILTAAKENHVDGGFTSSSEFPNSFIYSPGKKLEFRFPPKQ